MQVCARSSANSRCTSEKNFVRIALYYDGLCLLCRRAMRLLKRLDGTDVIELYDSNAFAGAVPAFLQSADLDAAMYAWDGQTLHRGYDAFAAAFAHLPKWRLVGSIMRLPPVRVAGLPVYALVARNRRRLGCRI